MKEIFVILAASMKLDDILQKMSDALGNFILTPSEDNQTQLDICVYLYLAHKTTNGSAEGAAEMIQKMNQFEEREKLFDTGNGN